MQKGASNYPHSVTFKPIHGLSRTLIVFDGKEGHRKTCVRWLEEKIRNGKAIRSSKHATKENNNNNNRTVQPKHEHVEPDDRVEEHVRVKEANAVGRHLLAQEDAESESEEEEESESEEEEEEEENEPKHNVHQAEENDPLLLQEDAKTNEEESTREEEEKVVEKELIVTRQHSIPLLLRCRRGTCTRLGATSWQHPRQFLLLKRKKKRFFHILGMKASEFHAMVVQRLRVRVETLWEEVRLPWKDRDYFLAAFAVFNPQGFPYYSHTWRWLAHLELLLAHHRMLLSIAAWIDWREELLHRLTNEESSASFQDALNASCSNNWTNNNMEGWLHLWDQIIIASYYVVQHIRLWRKTMWLPKPFLWKDGINYLIKMQSDVPSCLPWHTHTTTTHEMLACVPWSYADIPLLFMNHTNVLASTSSNSSGSMPTNVASCYETSPSSNGSSNSNSNNSSNSNSSKTDKSPLDPAWPFSYSYEEQLELALYVSMEEKHVHEIHRWQHDLEVRHEFIPTLKWSKQHDVPLDPSLRSFSVVQNAQLLAGVKKKSLCFSLKMQAFFQSLRAKQRGEDRVTSWTPQLQSCSPNKTSTKKITKRIKERKTEDEVRSNQERTDDCIDVGIDAPELHESISGLVQHLACRKVMNKIELGKETFPVTCQPATLSSSSPTSGETQTSFTTDGMSPTNDLLFLDHLNEKEFSNTPFGLETKASQRIIIQSKLHREIEMAANNRLSNALLHSNNDPMTDDNLQREPKEEIIKAKVIAMANDLKAPLCMLDTKDVVHAQAFQNAQQESIDRIEVAPGNVNDFGWVAPKEDTKSAKAAIFLQATWRRCIAQRALRKYRREKQQRVSQYLQLWQSKQPHKKT